MSIRVLIVDDDKKLLTVLKSLLDKEDHDVTTCQNGLEAIEKCRQQIYDLVITDLMMPGASGIDVLKEVRRIHPDTLVILITGFASLETAIQAIREGAYDYMTKPFKLEEFKIVVKNAREKILLIRENQILFKELQEAYKQLDMVRTIMGGNQEAADGEKGSDPDGRKNEPLIAGSMLSQIYRENGTGSGTNILSELERISSLKEKKLLSEEEFNLCKSKLLQNLKT